MAMATSLKDWRIDTRKSVEAASSEVGVTTAMWSRWENGRRKVPAERVLGIEAATGISRHDLRPDIFGPAPKQETTA